MTISVAACRVEATATASQTVFPYNFQITASTDLNVYVNEALISPSLYTVSGVGVATGGNVTFTTGLDEGDQVIILSNIAQTQLEDITVGGPMSAVTLETMADRLTRLIHQANEAISRCLQLNVALSHGKTGLELPAPSSLDAETGGSKVLAWNEAETNLELVELTTETGLVSETIPRSTYASFPAAGGTGKLRIRSDGHQGLYYNRVDRWQRVGGNVFDVTNFGGHPDASAAENDTAIAAAIAEMPAQGGTLYFPGVSADPYEFSTPLVFTKAIRLFGDGSHRSQAGTQHFRTKLTYTGSGTAITLTGSASTNSVLQGFALNHTGTADYGIEVTTAANYVLIADISMVSPDVHFAVAGIAIGRGGNMHSTTLEFCEIRNSAPIGIQVIDTSYFILIRKCAVHFHTDANIELGTVAGTSADHVRIQNTALENNTGGTPIRIQRHIFVNIEGCHFETTADDALIWSIDIDSDTGDVVNIINNYIRILGNGAIKSLPVRVNCANQHVFFENNYVLSPNDGSESYGMITNIDSRFIRVAKNYQTGTNYLACDLNTAGSSYANMDVDGYFRANVNGPTEGFNARMLLSLNPPVGNTGGGTDTLFSRTIRAGMLGRVGLGIRLEAYGNVVVGGNAKTMTVTFDGQTLVSKGPTTPGTATFVIQAYIVKEDNDSAECISMVWWDNAWSNARVRLAVTGFDTDMNLVITGAGTADDDIVLRAAWVTLLGQ